MKLALAVGALAIGFSAPALASYDLAVSGRKVSCLADDNYSWVLNAKRTSVKITVEGESNGPKKVVSTETDGATFVSYKTEEGTLTLSNQGDTFLFDGETEAGSIRCN